MIADIDFEKIEQSTDLISGYDEDLKIVVWNEALAARFGVTREKAIGSKLPDLFPHIADDFRLQCLREAAVQRKTFFFSSLPFLYEEGTYSQLITPVYGTKDCRILSIVRDHSPLQRFARADLLKPITADKDGSK